MSRTDERLFSAMHSRSFAKSQTEKKTRVHDRAVLQSKLRPMGEIVLAEIQKERRAIGDEIANLIHLEMSPEDVKATVIGLKIADKRMVSLQTSLNNLLRKPKKAKDEADV